MGAQVIPSANHGIIPAIEAAEPNPPHIMKRATKGGRTLWYCLKVIQQPERARACGSGPKCECNLRNAGWEIHEVLTGSQHRPTAAP